MGKVKTHESLMRSHDGLIDLEIGRTATQALNIDAPFRRVKMEGSESTSLAGQLNLVDLLVSTIVSCAWVTLRVFVGHGRSQCIIDCTRGNIFGGDEVDGFSLTLDFQFLAIR